MTSLRYEKINNSNTAITIDLHNDYSVKAISGYHMEKEIYTTTLLLKENNSDLWMEIDEADNLIFLANTKTIAMAVLNSVAKYLEEGFFDKYIEKYEYYLKCFDLGNTQLEIESGRPSND